MNRFTLQVGGVPGEGKGVRAHQARLLQRSAVARRGELEGVPALRRGGEEQSRVLGWK